MRDRASLSPASERDAEKLAGGARDSGAPHGDDAGEGPADGDDAAPPATLSAALEQLEALRGELEAKTKEAQESRDKFVRERAEVENFKRRMVREKSEALRYASESLLRELLPVIDNLQRAVQSARDEAPSTGEAGRRPLEAVVTGVEMVLKQLLEVLGRFGVARVPAAAQSFDPAHHEALAHVETESHPPGHVLAEHVSGYRLHDRLLRPAQVTVAKAPARSREDGAAEGSSDY